jgi:F420-dependent oxidoreductase-like protein
MDLRIFTEPQQGASYDDLLRVAKATEDLGFDAFFRSDHYLAMGGDGLPGPTDAWITLAGIARETSRIRLGTLVTPGTFRWPGVLAISVAQVDQMSGGRVELGLGTGWYDKEHTAYGIPFPSLGERFDRFEEQLQILRGLWDAERPFSFSGKHYELVDSPALPKPAQPHLPIIVGGFGAKRTPRIAAQWADEYNVPFHNVAETAEAFARVREAAAGREIRLSAAQTICVGTGDDLERRAAKLGRDVEGVRRDALGGSPQEVVDKLGQLAEAGATRAYLQLMDLTDIDQLELVAAEVLPQV